MNFRISLAQMQIEAGSLERNVHHALQMITQAAQESSQALLLPELWSSGYDLKNAALHAGATPHILAELQEQADQHKMIIAGSLLEEAAGQIYNTLYWIAPHPGSSASYRKIHLFRLMDEDHWLAGGERMQQVETPWGPTGLSICYDLRFPELFRRYTFQGVTAMAMSAEWPSRRIHHWEILLRARAIENQVFVMAANTVGISGGETFGGGSVLLTPLGEALIQGSQNNEELLSANLEPDVVSQVRAFMPVSQDRRPAIYS